MCSISTLREQADEAHARYSAARAGLLRAVADLAASEEWRDGSASLASFLAARWQIDITTARQLVRDAEDVSARPPLGEALAKAEISGDQCKALTVLCEEGSDDADRWLESLPAWPYPELRREARKAKARELERRDDGVYLRMRHTDDERYLRGEFQLHPEDGATVMSAVEARIPHGTPLRGWDRAAAQGLVELAMGTEPTNTSDRATVLVNVDHTSLQTRPWPKDGAPEAPAMRQVASLNSGGLVGIDSALRMACDGRIQALVSSIDGTITGIGTTSRTVPRRIRRAVERRDGGICTFPGCLRDRYLECHHITHVRDGGPTDISNLQLVCWIHHELLHEGGWTLDGPAGPHITWIRPDGTPHEPRVRVVLDTS